jgi:hypothetical protein
VGSRLNAMGDRIFGPAKCGQARLAWADPIDYRVAGAAAWADPDNCNIWLDVGDYPLAGPFLCHRWLHERGHLAGMPHSSNPRSIMYPVHSEGRVWNGRRHEYRVDRRCKHFTGGRRNRA